MTTIRLREKARGLIGLLPSALMIASVSLGLTAAVGAVAGAVEEPADRPLRIVGSGYSMPVLMRPWVEAFENETGIEVEVVPSGTSTGPPALIEGRADIAAMTRPLREAESEAISLRFGAPPMVLPVAGDEVAIFVNTGNPVDRITLAEIDAIYSESRRCGAPLNITHWGQLGAVGEFANRTIALFGRRPGSGTATFFRTRALCGGEFKDWMRISPGRTSASLQVVESRLGIGFGSLRDQRPGMKALAVAVSESGPFVRPGEGGSSAVPYPLARTLDFVVAAPASKHEGLEKGALHPALLTFLESVLSGDAQASASTSGYAPLTEEQMIESRRQLDSMRVRAASRESFESVVPPAN